jgi:hypothetical protein
VASAYTEGWMSLTKEDLEAALTAMKVELRDEFRSGFGSVKSEMVAALRQIETNLITEFRRYSTTE